MKDDEIYFLDEAKDMVNKMVQTLVSSNKTLEDLNCEQFDDLFNDIAIKNLKRYNELYMKTMITSFHKEYLKRLQIHTDIIEETFGSAFAYYYLFMEKYLTLSNSLKNFFQQYCIDDKGDCVKDDNPTLTVLRFLNGRAIHIANGILISLRNGYPDDGYSRVRTLYEILIIMNIIVKYDDKLAKRYMESDGNSYDWVQPDIKPCKGKFINLGDLEKKCSLPKEFIDNWKKEHKNMHKTVHASSKGTFNRIGGDMYKFISIGPTSSGIDHVANNTLRLMNMIFNSYLTCINAPDSLLIYTLKESYMQLLDDISKKMELEFDKAKKIHFDKNEDNSN